MVQFQCFIMPANKNQHFVHAKRGLEAIEAHGILPMRLGVLVHDCWAPYWRIDASIDALCNAHLLRQLLYVKELSGQQWPESMMQLLVGANRICAAARHQQRLLSTDEIAAFRTVYDALVREGEAYILKPLKLWDGVAAASSQSRPTCCAASAFTPTRYCASSAIRLCRSPTTLASAPCACPGSNRKYRAASARLPEPSISASSAPASTHYASKATVCSSSCDAPSQVILSRYLHSG